MNIHLLYLEESILLANANKGINVSDSLLIKV